MQTRRARVKSSLHHIRMVHLDIPWAVQITWSQHLSLQILLPSALYFLTKKALYLPGLDHWQTMQRATRSGNTSLAALQNNRQLPVLDDTSCCPWCKRSLGYWKKKLCSGSYNLRDLSWNRGLQQWFVFSQIHSCKDFFSKHRSMYRLERELS